MGVRSHIDSMPSSLSQTLIHLGHSSLKWIVVVSARVSVLDGGLYTSR